MSTTFIPLSAPTAPQYQIGWASRADWIRYKSLIKELYENHTLAKVIDIMESQHGLKATERMYKKHIKEWGLDKKYKENEMRAIVRKRANRTAIGKTSDFRIRGRRVDYAEIVRYWHRRRISVDDIVAQRALSNTPEAVECLTPVPSPISTPDVLAIPERILIALRDYHIGSFGAKTWIKTEPEFDCRSTKAHSLASRFSIDMLCSHTLLACRLFAKHKSREAGQALITATAYIQNVIQAEEPDTFAQVFSIIMQTRWWGRKEVTSAILRQISAMGEMLLGQGHPFARICAWLVSLDQIDENHHEQSITRSMGMIYECFEGALGPLHITSISARPGYLELLCEEQFGNTCSINLRKLLHKCEVSLGPDEFRTMFVRLRLANIYLEQRDFVQARETCQALLAQTKSTQFRVGSLLIVARCQYRLDETSAAETSIRNVIGLEIPTCPEDNVTLLMMIQLEEWLVELGELDSASQVQRDRLEHQEVAEIL